MSGPRFALACVSKGEGCEYCDENYGYERPCRICGDNHRCCHGCFDEIGIKGGLKRVRLLQSGAVSAPEILWEDSPNTDATTTFMPVKFVAACPSEYRAANALMK